MNKNETIILDLQQCYRSPEELKHSEMVESTPEDYNEIIIALDKKRRDMNKLRLELETLKNEYETLKLMVDKHKCSCCGCKEFRKVITNDGRTI